MPAVLPVLLAALTLAQADAPAPNPDGEAPAAAATPQADSDSADIPKGAPSDDFGFVAWCRGALTGHMALYELVKPELKSIERPGEGAADEKLDQEQMKAGREYLALYRRAMIAAEKAHPQLHDRGQIVEGEGESIWNAPRAADARTRMWSWLLWELPGRCEIAAKRLETHAGLLGAAFRDTPAAAPLDAGAAAGAPAPADGASPAATGDAPASVAPDASAAPAPADANATGATPGAPAPPPEAAAPEAAAPAPDTPH